MGGPETPRLSVLYDRYASRIRRRLRLQGPEAEDVLHDVFVALAGRPRPPEERCPEAAWVMQVARSVVSTHRRSVQRRAAAHRRLATYQYAANAAAPTDPADLLVVSQVARDDELELIRWVFSVGLTAAEYAGARGLPIGTVKSRVRRMRARLAATLTP